MWEVCNFTDHQNVGLIDQAKFCKILISDKLTLLPVEKKEGGVGVLSDTKQINTCLSNKVQDFVDL